MAIKHSVRHPLLLSGNVVHPDHSVGGKEGPRGSGPYLEFKSEPSNTSQMQCIPYLRKQQIVSFKNNEKSIVFHEQARSRFQQRICKSIDQLRSVLPPMRIPIYLMSVEKSNNIGVRQITRDNTRYRQAIIKNGRILQDK